MRIQTRFRCAQFQIRQIELLVVHGKPALQFRHLQSALLLQGTRAHVKTKLGGTIGKGVDSQLDIPNVQVVIVKSFHLGCETIIISQGTIVPIESFHLILTLVQIEESFFGLYLSQMSRHLQGVVRHAYGYITSVDIQLVNRNLPEVLTLRRIGRNGITQLHIYLRIAQLGLVDTKKLSFQVDAMTGKVHIAHLTFHPGLRNKMGGIESQVGEVQGIYLHLFLQQGPQLHVDHQLAHIGHRIFLLRKRVVGLQHTQSFHTEVQRELQVHTLHGDLHTGLL